MTTTQFLEALRRLSASPLARRLIATTFWSALGEALSKGLLLLSMVLVARILGKQGYGEFGMVRTTINLFATLGGAGLGFTANRYVAKFRDTDKPQSGQIIGSSYLLAAGFGSLVGAALIGTSGYLANVVLAAPQLVDGLRLAGVLVFLGAISGAQVGILQGLEAYRSLAFGGLVQGTTALTFFAAGAYYFGLNGALGAFLLYTGVGVLLYHVLIRRELTRQGITILYSGLGDTLPIFWAFSVPAALMGIAVAPFKWLVESELARAAGFSELGVFHASMTVVTIYIVLVSTINAPMISLSANLQDEKTFRRLQYLSLYGSWYLFLVLALPCIFFPQLPALLFGAKFATPQFHMVTVLLLFYCGLLMYIQGIMRLVAQHGSMWFGLVTNLCEGIALLVAFYYFADRGVVGLGLAYVCSYLVRVGVSAPFLLRQAIVPARLLFDRYFVATVLLLFALVGVQLARLS